MTVDTGHLILDAYREAAKADHSTGSNYKGLTIHALRGIHEEVVQAAAREVAAGADVLDLASGSGALCLRLTDHGFKVTACDLVTENFRLHTTLPFVEANLNLAFAAKFAQQYDAITATEIIEHVENPRHFIRQCFALLKPGGTLILTTPNIDSAIARAIWVRTGTFKWFERDFYKRDGHITPIPTFVLLAALDEAGFDLVRVSSVGHFEGAFLSWWRLHAFAWLIRKLDQSNSQQNEILFVVAKKPD